jgi:hypothetical protein
MCSVAVFSILAAAAQATARTDGSRPAPAKVVQLVTHVPAATLNRVGAGKLQGSKFFSVKKVHGSLKAGGKPELLAFALAWCPHCEADSWGMAIALSRFGTFSGLRVIDSGTLYGTKYHGNPPYPHTKGLSFFGTRYRSRYISFVNVVLQDVKGKALEKPTKNQNKILKTFKAIPAVDVGGKYKVSGAGVSPGIFAGKRWSQIAQTLAHPANPIAQRVDGLANLFTAAICKTTGQQPAAVCASKGVKAAATRLREG